MDFHPAARGATLTIRENPRWTTVGSDSLYIWAGEARVGTFTVEVTKSGYHPVVVSGATPPVDRCGAKTAEVRVTLTARSSALN